MTPLERRFWAKVDKSGECWTWTGMVAGQRYGRFTVAGGKVLAHRLAYELMVGPIGPGLDLCHRCDNDACVRPDHLFPATHAENMQDASAKGRIAWGERSGGSRLTADEVRLIRSRRLQGETTVSLGLAFGVNHATISRITTGQRWSHLTGSEAA